MSITLTGTEWSGGDALLFFSELHVDSGGKVTACVVRFRWRLFGDHLDVEIV